MVMEKNVVVIGAGIMGSSTAYLLKRTYPNINVTIIAKSFSPNTTSDGAAGFWQPFLPGDTPIHLIKKWSKDTYCHVMNVIKTNPSSSAMGVMTTHGYHLLDSEDFEKPYWADIPYDYHKLTKKDLERFPEFVKSGFGFTTVFIEGRMLIPRYTRQFKELGGKIIQKEIKSLSDIPIDCDVLINCTGFGARNLVDDDAVVPIRGQVLKVRAPWIREFVTFSTPSTTVYVLPNQDFVVLGGTKHVNNEDLTISLKEKEFITKATKEFFPSLEYAQPIGDWVGLRPARNTIRVEKEEMIINNHGSKTKIKIVHNYGHGGSGLTVHWGCAADAVKLASQYLNEMNAKQTSKLMLNIKKEW